MKQVRRIGNVLGGLRWWLQLDRWTVLRLPLGVFLGFHVLVSLYEGMSRWIQLGQLSNGWYVAGPVVVPLLSLEAVPPLLGLFGGISLFRNQELRLSLIMPGLIGIAVLVAGTWWVAPLMVHYVWLGLLLMN